MISTEQILARRDLLAAQRDQAELAYGRLEEQIKQLQQELATRDRQICAMAGGVQELDALLAEEAARGD